MPILLALLVGLLLAFQYFTLTKLAVEPAGAGLVSFAAFARNLTAQIEFSRLDIALGFALLTVVELLVTAEIWFRALTRCLDRALATARGALALCAITCLILVRFYFAPGQPTWAGDADTHIAYARIASESIAVGEFPVWTNAFTAGAPFAQFYGFLFFYLVGLSHLFVGDPFNAIKLVTGLSHWGSGLAMYLLVHTATQSRRAGLLAAIGYVAGYWHTQQVAVMGRLPLSVFYALLPLPFYALEYMRRHGCSARPVVGGAVALGSLAFIHVGYAFWGVFFFALYAAIRLADGATSRNHWLGGLGILGGGLIFGAHMTLPVWLERGLVGLEAGVRLGGGAIPGWRQLFVWSNGYFRLGPLSAEHYNWLGGYIGLSLAAAAAAGPIIALTYRIRNRSPIPVWGPTGRAATVCLCLSLFVVMAHDAPILGELAVVQAFNAGRYLLFAVFFLALAGGIGGRLLGGRDGGRKYIFVLLVVLVDLGSTTFRHLYIPRWAQPVSYPMEIVRDMVAETDLPTGPELPTHRLLATTQHHHHFLLLPWLYGQTRIPQVQTLYASAPKAWSASLQPWTEFVEHCWGSDATSDPTRDQAEFLLAGAKLYNVRDIFVARGADAVARIKTHSESPLLAAANVVAYAEEELPSVPLDSILPDADPDLQQRLAPVYRLVRAMEINLGSNICRRIYVRGHPTHTRSQESPGVEVREHRVYNQRVVLQLRSENPCYIRLAYAYYPHLQVTVNNHIIEPLETADHFIALPLDAGEHRIEINARLSPLRRALLLLNLALLCAGAAWMWSERKNA